MYLVCTESAISPDACLPSVGLLSLFAGGGKIALWLHCEGQILERPSWFDSYLKGRCRLSLRVPVARERRDVELGDGGWPAAGPELERRDVPDRGQVNVDRPELGDVHRVDDVLPGEHLRVVLLNFDLSEATLLTWLELNQ